MSERFYYTIITKNKNIILRGLLLSMLIKYQPLLVGLILIIVLTFNSVILTYASKSILLNDDWHHLRLLNDLKNFALSKINDDRKKYDLPLLFLSNNTAAQIHANELLRTKTISHLSLEGFKPYMLYSFYNGTGYVQQNIGQISYVITNGTQNYYPISDQCYDQKRFYCPVIDRFKAISGLQHSMMYNDKLCCNDGHKNNILNKYHTHVSIGIAYNDYYFVMVQNFENHYLRPDFTIMKNDDAIKLEARINDPDNFNFEINHVSFFLDEFPTKLDYEKNRDKNSYDFGDLKLMVSKPLPPDLEYVQEKEDSTYRIIEANKWELNEEDINLEIQIPDTLNVKDKILTMVLYAQTVGVEDNVIGEESDYVPLTSYTFFNS